MATLSSSTSYVTGWRTRHGGSTWMPSSSSWADTDESTGYTYACASNPGGTNKYTIILKIHVPTISTASSVDGVTIDLNMYKGNSTSGTIYGSLRTKVSDLGSSDSATTYRNNSIGSEASYSFGSTSYKSFSMSFTGTLSQNTDYYLVLYSKNNSDMFYARATDWNTEETWPEASFEYTEKQNHFFWYNSGSFDITLNPSYDYVVEGGSITLFSALANQSGTTYTVSYNANNGNTTPSSSTSTSTWKHTYWYGDDGNYYTPGSTISNVTSGLSLTAIWSETRKSVTLASAITRAQGTATRTVTFNANGGSCSTASLNSTAPITYGFAGWKPDNSGSALSAGSSYEPSGNVTMYASWNETTGNYSAINLPTPTREGYDFKGWNTSSTATSGSTGSYTPTASVTLYATWSKKTYTVSYNANGHGTAPSSQTKTHGTALTLRSFISNQSGTGYTVSFDRNGGSSTPSSQTSTLTYKQTYWNTAANGYGTNYGSGGSYSKEEAITLYAIWSSSSSAIALPAAISRASSKETGFKVTFNANGGTCSTTELTSENTRNYAFSKWAAGSTGGTKYSANASYTPTGNITMYATWTETVTNGSITLPTPTRTGYTFKGWSTNSSATSGSTGNYTPTAATTLYATWQINTWTVGYNANGYGTAPSSQTKTYGQTLTLRQFIADQTSTGYTVSFNRNNGTSTPSSLSSTITRKQTYWNTKSDGSGTNYSSGGSYTKNKAATLYAIWSSTNGSVTLPTAIIRNPTTETGYKVTFNANGGSCSITELTATNTRSYTFSKWAVGSASGTKYDAGASFAPTATTTMYATWTESVTNGSISLPIASKDGYSFVGWGTSTSATTGSTGTYTPSGNITLYAIYSANTYTVSYNANGYGTAPSSQTKTHDQTLTLQPFIANQTITGYVVSFDKNGGKTTPSSITSNILKTQSNWNTKADGTGKNYVSKDSYVENKDVTMYARWSSTNQNIILPVAIEKDSTKVSYTISYDVNGGNTAAPANQTNTRTTPYVFAGWAEGSINGTKYAASASYTPNNATTMYATWNTGTTTGSITLPSGVTKADTYIDGYTITLDANGGTGVNSSVVVSDTVKWNFAKWNSKADGTGTDYNANGLYEFNANTKLYARYTSSTLKGTINLPTPTRANYTFVGWATDVSASSGITGSYTPQGNTKLYAIWKQNNSLIHYNNNNTDVLCEVYYNNNGVAVLCNVYYNNNGVLEKI